jgi:hypothetical protein
MRSLTLESRISRTALGAAAVTTLLLVLLCSGQALAGKEHCRTINFAGAAGAGSTDVVTFRLVDEDGSTVLDQSCPVQVLPSETAHDYVQRIPAWWGCDPSSEVPCPMSGCPDTGYVDAVYTKPNGKFKLPKKFCGDVTGGDARSCKVKFIYKEKSTGEIKKGPSLKICCKADDECKGKKWGKESSETTPVNVQSQNSGQGASYLPPSGSLPVGVGEDVDVVVDPITLEQLPDPSVEECRGAISRAVTKMAGEVAKNVVRCHELVMGGFLVEDCNAINPGSAAGSALVEGSAKVAAAITAACSGVASPTKFAYKRCPAPCDFVPVSEPVCVQGDNLGVACFSHGDCNLAGYAGSGICSNTCSAGLVGQACRRDSDCDDGVSGSCGSWGEVSNCLACLTVARVNAAAVQVYGNPGPGPGLDPAAAACQEEVGNATVRLVHTVLKEAASCRRKTDLAKDPRPVDEMGERIPCKVADTKGRVLDLLDRIDADLFKACPSVAGQSLFLCGGLEASDCVRAAALPAARQLVDLFIPEDQ